MKSPIILVFSHLHLFLGQILGLTMTPNISEINGVAESGYESVKLNVQRVDSA